MIKRKMPNQRLAEDSTTDSHVIDYFIPFFSYVMANYLLCEHYTFLVMLHLQNPLEIKEKRM